MQCLLAAERIADATKGKPKDKGTMYLRIFKNSESKIVGLASQFGDVCVRWVFVISVSICDSLRVCRVGMDDFAIEKSADQDAFISSAKGLDAKHFLKLIT